MGCHQPSRDVEPSLRALLGEETPRLPSTISRVNKQFHAEYASWCERPIANEFVYLWADVMLVVMGHLVGVRKRLSACTAATLLVSQNP